MHLIRTRIAVNGGGAAELEDNAVTLGKLRTGLPGYVGQTLLHSYSHPSQYAVVSRWQDIESAWAFLKSDGFAQYVKERADVAYRVTDQDAFESVFEVNANNLAPNPDPSQSSCELLVDWMVSPGSAEAFEQSRQELFDLLKRAVPGFVSARLRRAAGTPGRYLAINIYSAVEAARTATSQPEIQQFMAAHPFSSYGAAPPTIEAYHVIHRM